MIELSQTQVEGLEPAIRGMRNPMASHSKSDSLFPQLPGQLKFNTDGTVGDADLELMHKLVNAGPDHRKFMRMIVVWVDIDAPLYWWKQFDTYKVGTVANSYSTMHKIHIKKLTLDDFSIESCDFLDLLQVKWYIKHWNHLRKKYLKTKDSHVWDKMVQLLPSSFNQKRTVMMSYENLYHMYHSRCNHKLKEWHVFCGWIKTLPYSELITEKKKERRTGELSDER